MAIADDCHAPVAVVVDRAGTIISACRSDGAAPIMVDLARRKAALSAALGAPTTLVAMLARTDPMPAAALQSVPDHPVQPGERQ